MTLVTVAMAPVASESMVAMSVLATLMGTASAILHGMLKQMASFVYPNCARLHAAVTSGMQASAIFVLFASITTGFGSSGESDAIVAFYALIATFTAFCWTCFHILMSRCRDISVSMLRRDTSFYTALSESLIDQEGSSIDSDDDEEYADADDEGPMNDVELDYRSLWRISWPCCLSIMVTVGSSMAVSSWFNRVESANPSNQTLPQVLFYTRLLADLLGRPATLLVKPSSRWTLLLISLCRLLFLPFFFLYASLDETLIPKNDSLIITGVAAFAFSSGFLVTAGYQLAPSLLTARQETSISKQAGLVNVCFSGALVCGLMASFVLLGIGVS